MNEEQTTQEASMEDQLQEQMMEDPNAGMQEDMNQRLMAVVGILSTALDKYIDIKVDYLSAYNKLQELKGEEGADTAGELAKCIAWKDGMLAQTMDLLGAEYEEPGMEQMGGDYE